MQIDLHQTHHKYTDRTCIDVRRPPITSSRMPAPKEESPFWKLLSRLMKEKGLTQKKLAAEIGVVEATLQYWRRNPKSSPDSHNLAAIAETFEGSVTLDQLMAAVEAGRGYEIPKSIWRKILDDYSKSSLGRGMPEADARTLRRVPDADTVRRWVHDLRTARKTERGR